MTPPPPLFSYSSQLGKLRVQPSACVGKAFVTFNRTSAARECRTTGECFVGGRQLRVRLPPDPSQVLWENLQFSRNSQWCRQLLSSLIVFIFIGIGTVIISATTIAKPYVEVAISCTAADTNHTISIGWWTLGACAVPSAPVQGCR